MGHATLFRILGYVTTLTSLGLVIVGRYCDSEDLMFLIYHLTLRDHMFKRLCDFMGGNPTS